MCWTITGSQSKYSFFTFERGKHEYCTCVFAYGTLVSHELRRDVAKHRLNSASVLRRDSLCVGPIFTFSIEGGAKYHHPSAMSHYNVPGIVFYLRTRQAPILYCCVHYACLFMGHWCFSCSNNVQVGLCVRIGWASYIARAQSRRRKALA